jgi:hypothetical protein
MRSIWAWGVAASLIAFSGCAMCESCLDHLYPAVGGCCCHHVDDCCRCGSAFCHDAGGGPIPSGEMIHQPGEVIHEPGEVPDLEAGIEPPQLPPAENGNGWRERPQPGEPGSTDAPPIPQPSQLPSPTPSTPPANPQDLPNVGRFPETEAPSLPDVLPLQ